VIKDGLDRLIGGSGYAGSNRRLLAEGDKDLKKPAEEGRATSLSDHLILARKKEKHKKKLEKKISGGNAGGMKKGLNEERN